MVEFRSYCCTELSNPTAMRSIVKNSFELWSSRCALSFSSPTLIWKVRIAYSKRRTK